MAVPISSLQPGQYVSFDVYPETILGNTYKRVRVAGILDAETAGITTDIVARHAQVYPSLPEGSAPDDPFGYNYLRIVHSAENGERSEVIGIPWIRPESVTTTESQTLTLFFAEVTAADINRILNAVRANGYPPTKIN
jgi:hypothetical protein